MSVATVTTVRAIVRIRLAPRLPWPAFEQWLRAIPAVLSAALITGEADYEVQLDCRGFADLGDALTRICGCRGVHLVSTALVLHEVRGLGVRGQAISDEVTMRRLGTM